MLQKTNGKERDAVSCQIRKENASRSASSCDDSHFITFTNSIFSVIQCPHQQAFSEGTEIIRSHQALDYTRTASITIHIGCHLLQALTVIAGELLCNNL